MSEDSTRVTEDDAGLPVVDDEGLEVGVVDSVTDDGVVIDPGMDVADDVRASLGWEDPTVKQPVDPGALEREGEGDTEDLRIDLERINR